MSDSQGFLTTHILDTAKGCPAKGVEIRLYRHENGQREHLASMVTNDDGRTDSPILPKGEMTPGTYELVFEIGKYFADDPAVADIPFIDSVPLHFGIADENDHYHVPLLVSPYSFSTYRGS